MGAVLPIIGAAAALLGAGSTAYGVYKSSKVDKPEAIAPPAPPEIPAVDVADEKRRRLSRSATLLTQPGALSETQTFKPTLLGQ